MDLSWKIKKEYEKSNSKRNPRSDGAGGRMKEAAQKKLLYKERQFIDENSIF